MTARREGGAPAVPESQQPGHPDQVLLALGAELETALIVLEATLDAGQDMHRRHLRLVSDLDRVDAAEDAAFGRVEEIRDSIRRAPAHGMAGIAVKLREFRGAWRVPAGLDDRDVVDQWERLEAEVFRLADLA